MKIEVIEIKMKLRCPECDLQSYIPWRVKAINELVDPQVGIPKMKDLYTATQCPRCGAQEIKKVPGNPQVRMGF